MSVDLTRNRPLALPRASADPVPDLPRLERTLSDAQAADQLALAQWPANHHIDVCSLAGGTGRTTMAGLIAVTLAALPYAHLHRPVVLKELEAAPLSHAHERWGAENDQLINVGRRGGNVRLTERPMHPAELHPMIVCDAPAGLLATERVTRANSADSVVLTVRPDRVSLAKTAEALLWLQDDRGVARQRITVVINDAAGRHDRNSKPAATALGIRCWSVHRLAAHPALGPGRVLPSQHVPGPIHKAVVRICLDVYRSIQPAVVTAAPGEEDRNA
ncbi:hypothetical protein FOE78_04985 [Microlunatus elymi]|uniref:MinD-like ATPase involved in chromosome partitioning or flagellar assembly n=1 Tax=Microlunatus elymi TaxID=2596828 RepID=A0A516PW40_9ACTN|nr:hypothetical protein FOE78_04985 [Microlunatus elymi]